MDWVIVTALGLAAWLLVLAFVMALLASAKRGDRAMQQAARRECGGRWTRSAGRRVRTHAHRA
jgi:hypothetical protein